MKAFTELGELIETQWRDKNYGNDVFPEIAANALSEADLAARIDLWDPVRWVHTTTTFPHQMDPGAKFGNPPITLFVGPRFYIDVYYWLNSTTAIHEHGFSGAFQVLHGGSVQGLYGFNKELEINPHLLIGDLTLKDVSLLKKGDVRTIETGSNFIHSLFHLERPSATIVVRTRGNKVKQYSYKKPYLAFNPFYSEPWMTRRNQTVSLLLSSKHPDADLMIHELLDVSDFHTTFGILETALAHLAKNRLEKLFKVSRSMDRFHAMQDRARKRHGALIDLLAAVFEEDLRQKDITKRRDTIRQADHRLFLGLLLNVPDRKRLLELIAERFPDDNAVDLVIRWVRELSGMRAFGSREPNVLGIEGIDDTYQGVLKGLLKGLPLGKVDSVSNEHHSDVAIRESVASIKDAAIFKSIFSENQISARELLCS